MPEPETKPPLVLTWEQYYGPLPPQGVPTHVMAAQIMAAKARADAAVNPPQRAQEWRPTLEDVESLFCQALDRTKNDPERAADLLGAWRSQSIANDRIVTLGTHNALVAELARLAKIKKR